LLYIAGMKKNAKASRPAPAPHLAPRRLPTQERARATVDLVLETAAAEIDRDGLDKLTTKRIAAAAGLSVGALYEYFPNKEAIVHALADNWLQKVREAIDAPHPRHGGQRDVFAYLNDQFHLVGKLYEDRPGLGALIPMLTAVPDLAALGRAHDELVSANVASGLAHYAPKADAAALDAAARCIGIVCHDVLVAALVHRVAPAELLFANLRACLVAIATPLILAR
jgi:AcrR family transcriptional regulator